MKKIFEKYPIFKYVVCSYVKTLLYSVVIFTLIFAVLIFTGLYPTIESTLDLKYNSPFVLVPLYGALVLAVLSFFVGFLMYFHKYKRAKSKTVFYKTFIDLLDKK